jgi:hypothetical protein
LLWRDGLARVCLAVTCNFAREIGSLTLMYRLDKPKNMGRFCLFVCRHVGASSQAYTCSMYNNTYKGSRRGAHLKPYPTETPGDIPMRTTCYRLLRGSLRVDSCSFIDLTYVAVIG